MIWSVSLSRCWSGSGRTVCAWSAWCVQRSGATSKTSQPPVCATTGGWRPSSSAGLGEERKRLALDTVYIAYVNSCAFFRMHRIYFRSKWRSAKPKLRGLKLHPRLDLIAVSQNRPFFTEDILICRKSHNLIIILMMGEFGLAAWV